jgi:hypothetical protein
VHRTGYFWNEERINHASRTQFHTLHISAPPHSCRLAFHLNIARYILRRTKQKDTPCLYGNSCSLPWGNERSDHCTSSHVNSDPLTHYCIYGKFSWLNPQNRLLSEIALWVPSGDMPEIAPATNLACLLGWELRITDRQTATNPQNGIFLYSWVLRIIPHTDLNALNTSTWLYALLPLL